MRKVLWWTGALVALLVTAGVMLQVSRTNFDTEAFGSWLAGTTTPLVVLIGIVTILQDRERTQQDQATAKQVASIQERIAFLSYLDRFDGHLRYLARCACTGSPDDSEGWRKLVHDPFRTLGLIASNNAEQADEANNQDLMRPLDGATVPFAREFVRSAEEVLNMGTRSGFPFMLDRRIAPLVKALKDHPAVGTPPKSFAKDE